MTMNPFTLMFGKEPYLTIPRRNIVSEVYSDFSSPYPTSQIYNFVSARGAGKTVITKLRLPVLRDKFAKFYTFVPLFHVYVTYWPNG